MTYMDAYGNQAEREGPLNFPEVLTEKLLPTTGQYAALMTDRIPQPIIKRRVMRLQVTAEFLVEMCKNTSPRTIRVTKNALPEDARFVSTTFDPTRSCVWIFVESSAFEEVEEYAEVPVLDPPVFERLG